MNMVPSLPDLFLSLPVLALILFRLTGMVLAAPLFSSTMVPVRVRVAIVLTLSIMILPMVQRDAPIDLTLSAAVAGLAGELLIGLGVGLSAAMILAAAEVAGLVVGQQAGIALAETFDPTFDQQSTAVAQLYSIVLTTVFLVVGGHRAMLAALLDTYQVVPVLSFRMGDPVMLLLIELIAAAFSVGLRLAGPVLIALFLAEIALVFLSRTMPQFNILSVGFTLRVLLSVAVIGLVFSTADELIVDHIHDGLARVRAAFGLNPMVRGLTL